jgi:hypothetical protein
VAGNMQVSNGVVHDLRAPGKKLVDHFRNALFVAGYCRGGNNDPSFDPTLPRCLEKVILYKASCFRPWLPVVTITTLFFGIFGLSDVFRILGGRVV